MVSDNFERARRQPDDHVDRRDDLAAREDRRNGPLDLWIHRIVTERVDGYARLIRGILPTLTASAGPSSSFGVVHVTIL